MNEHNEALFQRFLRLAYQEQTQAIETACEMAIQGGLHGVRVERTFTGLTVTTEARVDPTVPYGEIYWASL